MSRNHPQNGPSYSKAPYKKSKPLSDEELAEYNRKKKSREAELVKESQRARRFTAAIRATGGCIPVRGSGTKEFWEKIEDEPKK